MADTGEIWRRSAEATRDALWCEALIVSMGKGILDSVQVEKILAEFRAVRQSKDSAAKQGQ